MTVKEMAERLRSYPGSQPNEVWKLETDLMKCTDREKSQMALNGLTPEEHRQAGDL